MRKTMEHIFEREFLSDFQRDLTTYSYIPLSFSPEGQVLSSSEDQHPEMEKVSRLYSTGIPSNRWYPVHYEIFVRAIKEGPIRQTINHQNWYPHLASYLLSSLVGCLYRTIHDSTNAYHTNRLSRDDFACIVECLPNAETTPDNLYAFRAIAYLFPKAKLHWSPPEEFWFLSVEFLKVRMFFCEIEIVD